MELALTWDLVLAAVLVMLFAYNFLLGQNATIKLILSIYIAVLTADGIATIIERYIVGISPALQSTLGEAHDSVFLYIRLGIFLLATVLFVVRGGFHIHLEQHDHWAVRTAIHAVFSILSAFLFLGTVLVYLGGTSFAEGMLHASDISFHDNSVLARLLLDHYYLWFSLPAVGFLVTSFIFPKDAKL